MVRLKAPSSQRASHQRQSFNSTMVRLKEGVSKQMKAVIPAFQFHNGSIKSSNFSKGSNFSNMFQFHNGSIKRQDQAGDSEPICEFQFHNGSIKSATDRTIIDGMNNQFQFHNGSIKSTFSEVTYSKPERFQFHNGSIKSGLPFDIPLPSSKVSIPQWFD